MAWTRIDPRASITKSADPVTVKVRKPSRLNRLPALVITIVPERLEGGLAFWQRGASVSALIGDGEHSGHLRVEPGKDFRITMLGSKKSSTLIIPLPPSLRDDDLRRVGARISDHADDWIEIGLPAALLRKPGGAETAPPAPAPSAAPAGKVMTGFRTAATTAGAPRPAVGGR